MPRIETVDYPQDWPEADDNLMANFDGVVNKDVAARLRQEQVTANYPAWDFNAQCWVEAGKFRATVRRYHSIAGTFEADTPEELMEEISSEFGHK